MKKQKSKLIIAFLLSASMLFTSCNEKSDSSSSIEESKTSIDILSEDYSEISSESLEDTSELYSDETLDETSEELSFDESEELSSTDTSDEKTEESSEDILEESSSANTSDDKTELSSEDISEETPSADTSDDKIELSSEDVSEETPSADISDDKIELSSEDVSEESSSADISDDKIELSSEDTSSEDASSEGESSKDESSKEFSEEPSEKFGKEIKQEFPGLDFSYALYDIKSGKILTQYNTEKLFNMSYTIKPAYVLYLLSEGNINLTDRIELELNDIDRNGRSYIRDNLTGKYKLGDSIMVISLLEYTIVKNDNTAYRMLTKKYGYSGFNSFMEKLKISIRLGEENDPNYTLASSDEQLKVWIAINEYINKTSSDESKYFSKILKNIMGLKLVDSVIKENTQSILGWDHSTSTLHECYIIEDKYIAIILTKANISIHGSIDFTTIDSKPLEKIALGLKSIWEAYNK